MIYSSQSLIRPTSFRVLITVTSVTLILLGPGYGRAATPPADAPALAVPHRHHRSRMEERLSAFTRALDLDTTHQAQLRKVLEWRRAQVRKVWTDPRVPPDYRVTAAHAVNDQTAEQIRGLLNEEQKRKYKLPRQPHPAAEGEGERSVEDWMNTMKQQ